MSLINLTQPHLNESIREINKNSWLISNTLILTHSSSLPPYKIPADRTWWSDSKGGHFALSAVPEPLPDSKPLTKGSPILRVHAVDNQAAVWRAGDAFIKAHHMDYPNVTREHVTLQFLKDQRPLCNLRWTKHIRATFTLLITTEMTPSKKKGKKKKK